MKKLILTLAVFAIAIGGRAQVISGPSLQYSWQIVNTTATGQVGSYLSFSGRQSPIPSNYSLGWTVNGTTPTACTFSLQGSNDGSSWTALDSGSVSCTTSSINFVTAKPVTAVRVNLLTWTAADSTSAVAFTYKGSSLATPAASQVQIAKITVAGTTTTNITFSAIPQTYGKLTVSCYAMTNNATADSVNMQINGDTGADYGVGYVVGGINPVASGHLANQTSALVAVASASGVSPTRFGQFEITFLNYAQALSGKSFTALAGRTTSGHDLDVFTVSGIWDVSAAEAAVTSIKLLPSGGTAFVAGTTCTLYGS